MVVKATSQDFSPETLIAIKEDVLAMQAILSGSFDLRIDELKKLRDEISKKQGIIDTVDKADKVKKEADSYSEKIKKSADEVMRKAVEAQQKADVKFSEAEKKENKALNELASLEAELNKKIKENTEFGKNLEAEFKIKNDDLISRELFLKDSQDKFSLTLSSFDEEKKKFQEKVNAIMGK